MENEKVKVEKKEWKKCHYNQMRIKRRDSLYWSHERENAECSSAVCDDLNKGLSIDQVWRKDYNCGKKIKGE